MILLKEIRKKFIQGRLQIFLARVLFAISMILYIMFFYDKVFERDFYPERYGTAQFIKYFIYAFIINFGIYFLTTKMSEKYKISATILYLPSLFISPLVNGYVLGQNYLTIIFFLLFIFLYYYFNPWRRMGNA